MRFKLFAFIWFAALAAAPITLSADDGCCDKPAAACCDKPAMNCCDQAATHDHGAMSCCKDGAGCDMPCCKDDAGCDMPCCKDQAEGNAIDILIAMDPHALMPVPTPGAATRQTAVVFFQRPVWVGRTVLMGKYVIEHDTDRQARGEPCTHIYAADNQTTPVVTFHCTHLEGQRNKTAVVMLRSAPDGQQRFLQFQFANEEAAHGYPTER
jgi:hypothetical protein